MSADKTMENIKTAAEQAEEVEIQAQAEPDYGTYTHIFRKPFSFEGKTFESMSFDWGSLTGKDSTAVNRELRGRNVFVVVDTYTIEYLTAMAARACTDRDEMGRRVVSSQTLEALPVRDFRTICNKIRSFLLRAESDAATGDSGFKNDV